MAQAPQEKIIGCNPGHLRFTSRRFSPLVEKLITLAVNGPAGVLVSCDLKGKRKTLCKDASAKAKQLVEDKAKEYYHYQFSDTRPTAIDWAINDKLITGEIKGRDSHAVARGE